MNQQKIQKRARLFMFLFYFLAGLMVLAILLSVTNDAQLSFKNDIEMFVTFYEQTLNATTNHAAFWYPLISFNLVAITWIIIFLRAAAIFKYISLGTPVFSQTIIHQLNHLILWLYGITIVPMFLFPLLSHIMTGSYHFVLGIQSGLFLPLGLSLLIEIFKYGASLQYEVDETV